MRVHLIHNPVAGSNSQHDVDVLQQRIRHAGHNVSYQSAPEIDWRSTFENSCDLIAVAGGDGTAGRIAKKLAGRGLPVTFLPMGTANNIAKTFGLAGLSLDEIIDGWRTPQSQWIDIGVVESKLGSTKFIEGVGMGLFVCTMMEIDDLDALGHLESPEEKIVHALRILGERLEAFSPRRLDVQLDDRDLSGEYIMLEVMNIRFVGPNLYIAPDSDPCDGLFDVVLITESERAMLKKYLASWRRGQMHAPTFPTYKGRHLRVAGYGNVLHVDDEAWPPQDGRHHFVSDPIDIRARPRALEVLVPASRIAPQ